MSGICQFAIPASRDIEHIVDSIADYGSFDAAEKFLSDLNAKCLKLAQFPGMGRRRDELSPGLRSFPIDI